MYDSYNSFYVLGLVFRPCPGLFINITHPIFITFPTVIYYPYYRDREMKASQGYRAQKKQKQNFNPIMGTSHCCPLPIL